MTKITNILCFVLTMIAFGFICVGYAAVSDTLDISGIVEAEPPVYDTIVITDIAAVNGTNINSESHSSIIPTNIQATINGTQGQTVVYQVTVHNYSKTETYIYNGIRYSDVFSETLSKMSVSVSLDEQKEKLLSTTPSTSYVNGTPVAPGEDFVFYTAYTLTEDITSEEILINYAFDPVIYTVTYNSDNSIWAVDYIINNQKIYYVKDSGPSHTEADGRVFVDWINANASPVDSYPIGNTNSYTLSAKWDNLYLIMFVDKDGIILYEEVFSDSSTALSASGQETVNKILADLNKAAAKDDMTVTWSDYNIKNNKADTVVRPIYTYTGNLAFTPIDSDGDGIVNYYQVDAVSKLNDPVIIPGEHQDRPVEVINKLYKNENNLDYGAGIKTIEIREGVLRIERNALAYTADLETVYLPNSLEYIGKNAFSRNWSNDKKEITIHFNGTMAEWKELIANSHEDWDNGITTKSGSKVMCSDGYFEYNHGFIGIGAKWEEHKY